MWTAAVRSGDGLAWDAGQSGIGNYENIRGFGNEREGEINIRTTEKYEFINKSEEKKMRVRRR